MPGSHKSSLVRPSELFGSIGKMGSSVAGRNFGSNNVVAHDAAWDDSPEAHELIPGPRPLDGKVPDGCIKPEFRAGDIAVMAEACTHGVVPWRAEGRTRRCLMIRHDYQHRGSPEGAGALEGIVHPLTAELMSFAPIGHTKEVARMSAAEIAAAFDAAESRASAMELLAEAKL